MLWSFEIEIDYNFSNWKWLRFRWWNEMKMRLALQNWTSENSKENEPREVHWTDCYHCNMSSMKSRYSVIDFIEMKFSWYLFTFFYVYFQGKVKNGFHSRNPMLFEAWAKTNRWKWFSESLNCKVLSKMSFNVLKNKNEHFKMWWKVKTRNIK